MVFECLRVLIDVKQGGEEVLGLIERNLGVREEEIGEASVSKAGTS